METAARLRLYQYPYSPFCISIELLLRHARIPFEVADLPPYDPREVIRLTQGAYYQVPVLEDLQTRQVIYERNASGDDVPRYISELAPLLHLFPAEREGWQTILVHYIEGECESWAFKVNDAAAETWLRDEVARTLHRRFKERKYGVGCLQKWKAELEHLIAGFHQCLRPFESLLETHPFLTGAAPVFADYALCGVIGTFLFSGETALPPDLLLVQQWYGKMMQGQFRSALDDVQMAAHDQFSERADQYGKDHILADVSDVEKVLDDLKIRPGTRALDVATGNGHTALCLAARGLTVTASDISGAMLAQATALAKERHLTLTLQEHPAEQLPYADGAFGLVICRVAAHHFSDPAGFVREASRVLKHYGSLVVIDGCVPDDQIEPGEWLNRVEKLRDPSHVQLYMPQQWRRWCIDAGLTVLSSRQDALKQKDLNWYLNVANTPEENRKKVRELVAKAPVSARELFKIGQEEGKIVWTWRRLVLIAGKL